MEPCFRSRFALASSSTDHIGFALSLARDITERKRAEEALRESEAKLQKAERVAHFGWWERDFTTNRVSLSDEVCRTFGFEPVELPNGMTAGST